MFLVKRTLSIVRFGSFDTIAILALGPCVGCLDHPPLTTLLRKEGKVKSVPGSYQVVAKKRICRGNIEDAQSSTPRPQKTIETSRFCLPVEV